MGNQNFSLSALGGGEGRGEVGDLRRRPPHPPVAPSPPQAGGEGKRSSAVDGQDTPQVRRWFSRSAQYAGFFEHGKDRLVMPGVSPDGRKDPLTPQEPDKKLGGGGKGDGGGEKPRHPFIEGLLKTSPDPESDEE